MFMCDIIIRVGIIWVFIGPYLYRILLERRKVMKLGPPHQAEAMSIGGEGGCVLFMSVVSFYTWILS